MLTTFSCDTCQKFMVDYDWQHHTGTGRIKKCGGGKMDQPRAVPPPCRSDPTACPKGSPEREHEFILSARNWKSLNFYRAAQATQGRSLTDEAAQDRIVQANMAIIDQIVRRTEQKRLAEQIASQLPIMRTR